MQMHVILSAIEVDTFCIDCRLQGLTLEFDTHLWICVHIINYIGNIILRLGLMAKIES